MEINKKDWEKTGRFEKFDNCEGFFDTFYNNKTEETLHVWHSPTGGIKLMDEELRYEYDKDDWDNSEEIENCHELMSIN